MTNSSYIARATEGSFHRLQLALQRMSGTSAFVAVLNEHSGFPSDFAGDAQGVSSLAGGDACADRFARYAGKGVVMTAPFRGRAPERGPQQEKCSCDDAAL